MSPDYLLSQFCYSRPLLFTLDTISLLIHFCIITRVLICSKSYIKYQPSYILIRWVKGVFCYIMINLINAILLGLVDNFLSFPYVRISSLEEHLEAWWLYISSFGWLNACIYLYLYPMPLSLCKSPLELNPFGCW